MGQLNRQVAYPSWSANQLVALNGIGLFEQSFSGSPQTLEVLPDPSDETLSLQDRAKSILHADCGHCHLPGGFVPPELPIDFRWSTPLADMAACDVDLMYVNLGSVGSKVIDPGNPENSNALQRMMLRTIDQMPPMGTTRVDTESVKIVTDWISSLDSCQ